MTRAADRLGGGSSFESLARPRSERGRAKAIAEGSIPEYELRRFDLAKVVPCGVNPRKYFGTDEEQVALGHSLAKKQTTACVAVTREAYVALWPLHEQDIGTAEYVVLNGERRYRAAMRVGLEQLDFVVRDDLATSCADFIDYLMLENDERQDFNIMERARGLSDLLAACDGNAAEVARRRGKDRSWVGNQIALLTLPDAIQHMLIHGTMAERYARRLARALKDNPSLSAEELLALEAQLKAEEKGRREGERALLEAAKSQMLSADNTAAASLVPSQHSAVADHSETVLSADNIATATADPISEVHQGPASPTAVLSADNIHSSKHARTVEDSNPPSLTTAEPHPGTAGVVLSADNTTPAESAAPKTTVPKPVRPSATELVRALGTTAAEQAATLRDGLDEAGFKTLLQELQAKL